MAENLIRRSKNYIKNYLITPDHASANTIKSSTNAQHELCGNCEKDVYFTLNKTSHKFFTVISDSQASLHPRGSAWLWDSPLLHLTVY